MNLFYLISDTVKAYDRVWILGDDFMSKSYAQYFQNAYFDGGKLSYLKAHYDITGICLSRLEAYGTSLLIKMRNHLVKLLNDQVLPPRAIIIILDDDMIREIKHNKPGISEALGRLFEWLINQYHRIITSHKERLPTKSRKFKYPHFLWIPATYHTKFEDSNEFRKKNNIALSNVTSLFREMTCLELKGWDPEDQELIVNNRFTSFGSTKFWLAVNDAFETWDRDQMKQVRLLSCEQEQKKKVAGNNRKPQKKRKFQEDVARKRFVCNAENVSFKLPKP